MVLIGRVLRDKRNGRLTQEALGKKAGVCPQLIGFIENDVKRCQPDLAARVGHILGTPAVPFALCHDCPANLIVNVLNPQVADGHPLAQQANIAREFSEAIAAITNLNLLNKDRLDGGEIAELERALLHLLDAPVAVVAALTMAAERYGVDVFALVARQRAKLGAKGLLYPDADAAAACG